MGKEREKKGKLNKWKLKDVSVERVTQKKTLSSQMGLEATTVPTLVGYSNHWATENSSGEQWSIRELGDTITAPRGHIVSIKKLKKQKNWTTGAQRSS